MVKELPELSAADGDQSRDADALVWIARGTGTRFSDECMQQLNTSLPRATVRHLDSIAEQHSAARGVLAARASSVGRHAKLTPRRHEN